MVADIMVAVMYLSQHQVSKLFMFPVLFPIALYNHFYDQSFTQVEIIGQLHHYLSEDGKLFQRIELVDISLQEPPPCISHYQVPISSFTLYITIHIRISIYHRYHYHQLHYQLHYQLHCYTITINFITNFITTITAIIVTIIIQ